MCVCVRMHTCTAVRESERAKSIYILFYILCFLPTFLKVGSLASLCLWLENVQPKAKDATVLLSEFYSQKSMKRICGLGWKVVLGNIASEAIGATGGFLSLEVVVWGSICIGGDGHPEHSQFPRWQRLWEERQRWIKGVVICSSSLAS